MLDSDGLRRQYHSRRRNTVIQEILSKTTPYALRNQDSVEPPTDQRWLAKLDREYSRIRIVKQNRMVVKEFFQLDALTILEACLWLLCNLNPNSSHY